MRIIENFLYRVRVQEQWIPLPDGTRLWAKLWRPVTDEPLPALLEYLPYRHGDWTAPRDHERHPYYAGHGYVSIRVDIRGHGSSQGVPGDEYDEQEQADGVHVIEWIAAQPWCTGDVGMFGISWGGFNALQLSYRQPEALKAIVTVCSADDRYDNDVHYMGGSMLAVDMHAWAATMLAFESRPPDPRVVGYAWREQWLDRLENMQPYLDKWMSHQTRDDYWRFGSVCEDYSRLNAPVLAVGGWFDPYRDTVLRLVEHLSVLGKNVRGIIGPWSHQYPDRDLRPGPHIDFLGETLRWFDHWLKGIDSGAMDQPFLRAWVSDSFRPAPAYENIPGSWVAENQWPSPNVQHVSFPLDDAAASPFVDADSCVLVDSPLSTGQDAGRYFPYGNNADLPVDQRAEDGRSVVFDFPVSEDVVILGNPHAQLRITTQATRGQVYVRLLDVAPDGSSTLVTRGNLNLSAREGREKNIPFPAGEWVDASVPMTSIGYTFPAGHVLRVALSSTYWPWIWPQAETQGFHVDLSASRLVIPKRPCAKPGSEEAALDHSVRFDDAVQSRGLEVLYPASGRGGVARPERLVSRDVAAGTTMIQVDPAYGGTRIYPDGLHYVEDTVERYWITDGDPLSARTEATWNIGMSRPDLDWETSLTATTRIHCDASMFYTHSHVVCREGNQVIFERTWEGEVPRVAS